MQPSCMAQEQLTKFFDLALFIFLILLYHLLRHFKSKLGLTVYDFWKF